MTAIYPKEICTMCGNYLDDDMKCYECEDCNMKHSTEDAFDIGDTVTVTSDTTFDHTKFTGEYDPVNKPPHYTLDGGLECIDYMRQVLGLQGFIDYCHGNVIISTQVQLQGKTCARYGKGTILSKQNGRCLERKA